jgi:hypothetical protein
MKKTSIVLLIILPMMLLMTSCLNDFLTVEPVSDTYSAKFWKTELEARTGLNSIYADFQNNFKGTGGMTYIGWYELRSDNCYGIPQGGSFLYSEVNMNKIYPSHPCSNWNVWYKSISMANIAIYYIQQMTNISEIKQNNLLAEAYFLRAYCYFNMVRIWGNVPIIVKPLLSFSDVTYPSRDSCKVVMDSVILKDLELAVSKVDPSKNDMFLFNVGPLYSLCTDVAMWNHDYVKAEKYSALLLGLNRYTLASGPDFYKTVSIATTTENIWTLKWSYINNGYNPVVQSLYSYTIVAKPVVDKWKTAEWRKDLRRPQSIDTLYNYYGFTHLITTDSRASMWKYEPVTRIPNNTNEKFIPLYRLADIILLRAEALNKLGRFQDALDQLNLIRTRAGLVSRLLTDYDLATDKMLAIETDILQERQFELLGEGKRWFDLVRTGRAISTMNNYFETYLKAYGVSNYKLFTDQWQLYWPVFKDNIVENKNLTQTGQY